ncbi:MAG: hypothetical protein LBS34_01175 [Rickettsiales bacterium]|jgi:hypothetical protein|nr:hypothetical protein [Rickettsiales bacterium]
MFFVLVSAAKAESLPSWYINKPDDSKLYYYGTGTDEKSVENAAIFALGNILRDIYEKNRDRLNIDFETFKNSINFPKYNIESAEKIGDLFYVIITIRKNELFNLQLSNLEETHRDILKKFGELKGKNKFVVVSNLEKILKLVSSAENKMAIIGVLGKFTETKYQNTYEKVRNKYDDILQNLDLRIVMEQPELEQLRKTLANYIENRGIKVDNGAKNTLFVSFRNKKLFLYNIFSVNILVSFRIMDDNDKLLYYESIESEAQSTEGYANATNMALNNVKNMCKKTICPDIFRYF